MCDCSIFPQYPNPSDASSCQTIVDNNVAKNRYLNYKHKRLPHVHTRSDNPKAHLANHEDVYPLSVRRRINTYLNKDVKTGFSYPTNCTNIPFVPKALGSGCKTARTCKSTNDVTNLKIIRKIVRIPCSLYVNNMASLAVYQKPDSTIVYPPGVTKTGLSWNQMSDRIVPSVQKAFAPSHGSSKKTTITRNRPGAGTPGGLGVDIKHNSYERRLLKLKGKNACCGKKPVNSLMDVFGRHHIQ